MTRTHEHKCPGCGAPIDCDFICCENCDVSCASLSGPAPTAGRPRGEEHEIDGPPIEAGLDRWRVRPKEMHEEILRLRAALADAEQRARRGALEEAIAVCHKARQGQPWGAHIAYQNCTDAIRALLGPTPAGDHTQETP